jgi:uncharacterized protein YciI
MTIIERTCYWAHRGRAADVLRTRREASDIRVRLGLPRGEIASRVAPEGDGPDVAWECRFASAEAHAADLAARDASAEFRAVRARMEGLLARFERQVLRPDGAEPPPDSTARLLFVVQFEDEPDRLAVRQRLMAEHIAWLDAHRDRVLVGGSLRELPSDRPIGGLWVVAARDRDEIDALLRTDPFWTGGLRRGYRINRWSKAFPDRQVPV